MAEERLEPLRVLQTRHLNEDTVDALTLDGRLGGAEGIDALADNLQRLLNGTTDFGLQTRAGELKGDDVAVAADVEFVAESAGAEKSGVHRLRELSQFRQGAIDIGWVCDPDSDAAARAAQPGIGDLLFAQRLADVADQLLGELAFELDPINLQKDVRAPLKIEAENHGLQLMHKRKLRPGFLGHDIGQGKHRSEQNSK